jgi:hypothetical protein
VPQAWQMALPTSVDPKPSTCDSFGFLNVLYKVIFSYIGGKVPIILLIISTNHILLLYAQSVSP